MQQLWRDDRPSNTDPLRVAIHRLRRKLGDTPSPSGLLQSVAGIGIMLRNRGSVRRIEKSSAARAAGEHAAANAAVAVMSRQDVRPIVWLIIGLLVSYAYTGFVTGLFAITLPHPLFPPQAVILSVLLLTPVRCWWVYLLVYYLDAGRPGRPVEPGAAVRRGERTSPTSSSRWSARCWSAASWRGRAESSSSRATWASTSPASTVASIVGATLGRHVAPGSARPGLLAVMAGLVPGRPDWRAWC